MATLYSTLMANGGAGSPARGTKAGDTVTRVASYVSTAAFSAGDSIQVVKIPHGAIITDFYQVGATPDGSTHFGLGVSGSTNLFGSATISATRAKVDVVTALPYTVSVSADAANRFITLLATVGTVASATASNSVAWVVKYITGGA